MMLFVLIHPIVDTAMYQAYLAAYGVSATALVGAVISAAGLVVSTICALGAKPISVFGAKPCLVETSSLEFLDK